jgi:hypothetical protein
VLLLLKIEISFFFGMSSETIWPILYLARSVLCLSCKNHEIMSDMTRSSYKHIYFVCCSDPNFFFVIIPLLPEGGGGYTVLPLSVLPSVQDIFRRIFLSNYQWQKSDIWSQASYRYAILWVAFLDPSDSYFLFADLVGFYTH